MNKLAPQQLLHQHFVDDVTKARNKAFHLWLLIFHKLHSLPTDIQVVDSLPVCHDSESQAHF